MTGRLVVVFRSTQRNFSAPTALSRVKWGGGRQSSSGLVATVFGASGFLGRYVVQKLGDNGTQIVIPYRGDGMHVRHLKPVGDLGQIVPLPFDITDEDSIRRAVAKSSVVINLIGSQLETKNYSHHDVHVKVAHQIARICAETGKVERFIHVSALGADLNSSSTFLRSKAEGEAVVKHFFPEATIMRPSPIFGFEDKFLNRIASMINFSPVTPLVASDHKIQPIHVFDVAQAILNALISTQAAGKTYHLGGPETFTQKELVDYVAKEIYNANYILPFPLPIAKIVGRAFEFLPTRWRLATKDMFVQASQDVVVPEGELGLNDLAVVPAPLRLVAGDQFIYHRGERELPPPKLKISESKHPHAKPQYLPIHN